MHNDGEREPLFKAIEENYKENRYVTKSFKKYLPFIFTEDDVLKIKFKNKVLLVVPKSLRYEIISLSHSEWYSGHFGIFSVFTTITCGPLLRKMLKILCRPAKFVYQS